MRSPSHSRSGSEHGASLGRLQLVRKAQARVPARATDIREAAPSRGTPWSRGLWGVFMPDRRAAAIPVAVERRS